MIYKQSLLSLSALSNEIFDLSEAATNTLYQSVKSSVSLGAENRDILSWGEIQDGIEKAATKYKGDGIIVIDGAYPHIIGALASLSRSAKYNIHYLPLEGTQISLRTLRNGKPIEETGLRTQIERCLEVVKYLGFDDMEEARTALNSAPRGSAEQNLIVVVASHTGMHSLYDHVGTPKVARDVFFRRFTEIILKSEEKPSFVFYSGEDVSVDGFRTILADKKAFTSVQQSLIEINGIGIPVEISAFGHKDGMVHYDEGHASGANDLFDNIDVRSILRNHTNGPKF